MKFSFDRDAMIKATKESPEWIHFGGGNIFRAFPAAVAQDLLNKGIINTGIIVAEGFDYEIIDKAYNTTEKILNEHMDKLTFIAEYLIAHELMDEDQFKYVMENDEPTVEDVEAILESKNKKSDAENLEQKELNEQKEKEEAEKKAEENTSDVQKFTVKKKEEEDSSEPENKE